MQVFASSRYFIPGAAVLQAVREYLRMSRLRELIAVSGQIEFDDNWRELEAAELAEAGFPGQESGA